MSGKKEPGPTSDAASEERIADGKVGLERTKDLMRRLLKVPKSEVMKARAKPKKRRRG